MILQQLILLCMGGSLGPRATLGPLKTPQTVKYIEVFHAYFSYLSIYEHNMQKNQIFFSFGRLQWAKIKSRVT